MAVDTLVGILFVLALMYPIYEVVGGARISSKLWNNEDPTLHFSLKGIRIESQWRMTHLSSVAILSVNERTHYFVIVFRTGAGLHIFKRFLAKDDMALLPALLRDIQAPKHPPPLPT